MSTDPMPTGMPKALRGFLSRRILAGAAGAALLVAGAGIGAVAASQWHGSRTAIYVPVPPVAISAAAGSNPVAVKGQVAEIFGNKFILQDASGRALVETGRQGENGDLVAKDEAVTVQGRFEHGFLHAQFLVHSDGKTVTLDQPHGPPPHRPAGGPHDRRVDAGPTGSSPPPVN